MKKRALILAVAMIVTVTAFVGGTLAWFTDSEPLSQTGTATFSIGDVGITSAATFSDMGALGTLIPGTEVYNSALSSVIPPYVTVTGGSEDCYVFIEIVPSFTAGINDISVSADMFVSYDLLDNWTQLSDNVYYTVVQNVTDNVPLPIYDTISTPAEVTKAMIDLTNGDSVTLAVNTYAIQYAGFETDATAAWNAIYSEYFGVATVDAVTENIEGVEAE